MRNGEKMRKYTKKDKELMNNAKKEKNVKLGQRLKVEIEKNFKTHQMFIEACTEHSNYSGTSTGTEYISRSNLSNILNGITALPPDRAEVFAEVLGVPAAYLLGYQDYPSKEAAENALWLEALSKWDKEDQERIETLKRIMSILSDRQFIFEFQLKEQYEVTDLGGKHTATAKIYSHNMQYTLIDNGSYPIDDLTFFSWLRFNTLTIKIKNDSTPKKYYHLDAYDNKKQLKHCINIIDKKSNRWIELDINSFMHMIYDIDESIKATIQNRCDCWMKYANFDYKEALDRSFDPIT